MNNKKKQHKFSKEREREKMVLENVSITVVFRARDEEKKTHTKYNTTKKRKISVAIRLVARTHMN